MSAFLYDLTSLTGRKRNAGRTVIVSGFEFGRRALIVTIVALAAAGLPALLLGALFGPLAFIITVAGAVGGAFVLVEGRTRNGLQVRRYQGILDKKKAEPGVFYICFRPVNETLGQANIVASSAPVEPRVGAASNSSAVFAPALTSTRARPSVASALGDSE